MSTTADTAGTATLAGRAGVDSLLARLRSNTLVPLLVAAAAAVALIAALFLWASSPEYRVLFSNLAEADGGRIIAELDSRQVPYKLSEGGNAILVPEDRVHVLRLQLAEQGLPQGGNVGLSLMETQAFGISQFAEQVNYQRGLEGELVSSIESLGPVAGARVHLALARDSVFVRDREPAKASVVLTLHPGRALGAGQVNAIMHLVSSSVPDLAVSDVTVVDHSGVLLSPGGSAPNDLDGAQLSYTREVERSYQQGIENILAPLFGKANIRVQVAAELDFSRREETAERYGPNQNGNPAAVRSTQLNTSYNGSEAAARGIPGALSNTPPGWTPSPVEEKAGGDDAPETAQHANLTHNNVVNYEVDRNITHIQHQRGQLQRLSVAVVVNHRDGVDEEGNPQRLPLSDEELDQVNRLVRQAMGFSESRGDRLEVVNSPFTDRPDSDSAEPAWWTTPLALDLAGTLGRYLLVALLALAFYRLVLRPLLRRHLAQQQPAPSPGEPAITPNAAAAGAAAAQAIADGHDDIGDGDGAEAPRRRKRKSSSYEQDLAELRDIASQDPRMVAMVVRTWMTEHA